jgi:hypothetical protein
MKLSLDNGWSYDSSSTFSDVAPVPALSAFRSDPQQAVYLKRGFDLAATDDCVNYMLCLDSAPPGTRFTLNDQPVPVDTDRPYRIDVTMFVALEDNQLLIYIPPEVSGAIRGLALEAVPCDEPTH